MNVNPADLLRERQIGLWIVVQLLTGDDVYFLPGIRQMKRKIAEDLTRCRDIRGEEAIYEEDALHTPQLTLAADRLTEVIAGVTRTRLRSDDSVATFLRNEFTRSDAIRGSKDCARAYCILAVFNSLLQKRLVSQD
jgi:hypothetical protein